MSGKEITTEKKTKPTERGDTSKHTVGTQKKQKGEGLTTGETRGRQGTGRSQGTTQSRAGEQTGKNADDPTKTKGTHRT